LLSVFCPHVAEECWEKIGAKGLVSLSEWPVFDEDKIDEEFDKAEEAVDKVVGDVLNILKIMSERGAQGEKVYLYVLPQELERYDSAEIKRRVNKGVAIYRVNDPDKVDPEGKAKKAKPGKPAIYIE
jgi:leucyl-tRNA synthetase